MVLCREGFMLRGKGSTPWCYVGSKAVRYTSISNYQGIKSLGQRYFSSLPKFVMNY